MSPAAVSAVFLDLGNTLLCERGSRAELYAAEGRVEGLEIGTAAMAELMARAHAALPRELDGAFRYSDAWFRAFQRRIFVDELGLPEVRLAALSQRLFTRFEDARTFELFPGARELLSSLRARGIVLGLISNWSERLPRLLDALELAPAFDFVLGSAALRMEKPERALFELAVRRAGVPRERCLHAGDDLERDVRGARAAGLAAVLVDHARRGAAGTPCPVVTSLPALADLILSRA